MVTRPQITPEDHLWGVYTEYVGNRLCVTRDTDTSGIREHKAILK
jgi:hypothetical protein